MIFFSFSKQIRSAELRTVLKADATARSICLLLLVLVTIMEEVLATAQVLDFLMQGVVHRRHAGSMKKHRASGHVLVASLVKLVSSKAMLQASHEAALACLLTGRITSLDLLNRLYRCFESVLQEAGVQNPICVAKLLTRRLVDKHQTRWIGL